MTRVTLEQHSKIAVADGLALIWRQGFCNDHVDAGRMVDISIAPV